MIANPETAAGEGRFGETARRTLRALVCRILPSDDGFGAAEAGCPDYVVAALETRSGSASLARIERSLRFLDDLAAETSGCSFAGAAGEEQDRAIGRFQVTPHPTTQAVLHLVVNLTLEGFLGDPRHGGNRGRVGWRFLGLDGAAAPRRGGGSGCTTS